MKRRVAIWVPCNPLRKAVSAFLMEGASLIGGARMLCKYMAAHMGICLAGWVRREAFGFPKS